MPLIPFLGASWNRKVEELGLAEDQSVAQRFYWKAGAPAPAGDLVLALGDYSVPIVNAKTFKPNTLVKIYQSVWAQNLGVTFGGGMTIGTLIPWNFAWRAPTGTDRCMIIENFPKIVESSNGELAWGSKRYSLVYGEDRTLSLWGAYEPFSGGYDVLGPNVRAGFNDLAPQGWDSIFWSPNDGRAKKIVVAQANLNIGNYTPQWKVSMERGCGLSKRVGVLTADEVISGTIAHALEVTIPNTSFAKYPGTLNKDYVLPATRCEWDTSEAPHRPHYDPDPANNFNHGLRLHLTYTQDEIDKLAKDLGGTNTALQTANRTILRCLVDYGFIVMETGGYGCAIETTGFYGDDGVKWKALGFQPGGTGHFALKYVLNPNRMRVVKPAL